MKNVRFGLFAVILTAGVTAAVGTLVAQAPAPRPEPPSRRVLMLDGRGSQIGVMVNDLNAEELEGLSGGVRIEDVDRDSPAAKAGLQQGDIVVEFDGERVRSARQFSRLVEETVGGRTVTLGIVRGGQRQTVSVTPEDRALAFGFDGDRIGGEIARQFREMEPRLREIEPRLREIEPRLREFRMNPPAFDFNFQDMLPGNTRGRLGVESEALSPQLAQYFGVKDGGVLVSAVREDSPAAKAGIKAGDVITSINGDRVRDYGDLVRELRDKTGEISVGIVRDKKETTLKATIEPPQSRNRRPLRPAID